MKRNGEKVSQTQNEVGKRWRTSIFAYNWNSCHIKTFKLVGRLFSFSADITREGEDVGLFLHQNSGFSYFFYF